MVDSKPKSVDFWMLGLFVLTLVVLGAIALRAGVDLIG
jgi:hypothetical protein